MKQENVKQNKKVLVTGGTRGIGNAIATALLEYGYAVSVTGTSARRPEILNSDFAYIQSDFKDRQQVENLAKSLGAKQFDVLVNNVGVNHKGSTVDFDIHKFDEMVDINLRTPYALIQAALPHMISQGWGRVVNITSIWGVLGNAHNAAYCATKFGLDGLTVSLAAEYADKNILINAVAPGYTLTEAAKKAFTDQDLSRIKDSIPMKRLGTTDEVGTFVAWLASSHNSYITGQNILIDGGLTRTSS